MQDGPGLTKILAQRDRGDLVLQEVTLLSNGRQRCRCARDLPDRQRISHPLPRPFAEGRLRSGQKARARELFPTPLAVPDAGRIMEDHEEIFL